MWPLQLKDQPKRRYSNEIKNNRGNQHIHSGVPSGTPDSYSGAIVIYIPSFSKKLLFYLISMQTSKNQTFSGTSVPTNLQFKDI